MPDTDAELIRRSLTEAAAFEGIFDRHFTAVLRYARQRVGYDVGEDLAAQTFVIAFDRRSTYKPEYLNARPWLLGIATNLLRHHLRDEAVHLRTLKQMPVDEYPEDHDELDDRIIARGLAPALLEALQTLNPGDLDAFLLSVLAEFTYEEVAVALGIPVGTVRSRIHRVRRILRERLGPLVATQEETDGRA
jgi:RNA polymerase sigma factor (sigma-70 family)